MNPYSSLRQEAIDNDVPIIQDEGLAFLLKLLNDNEQIINVLEVGTAIGYSALEMANVRDNIKIDTIEKNIYRYSEAKKNIQKYNKENQISLFNMDAIDFVSNKTYDLFFIDGPKAQYRNHFEHFKQYSHISSFFLFDNLAFHGLVQNPELTNNKHTIQLVKKIKDFIDYLYIQEDYTVNYYPELGDGIALVYRLR